MKAIAATLVVITIACSCGRRSLHASSVNVDSLANAYAELLVLNERYSLGRDTLSAEQYQHDCRNVLQRHQYTEEEFESQMETVAASPDEFRVLCDRALARFQDMRRGPMLVGVHS